MPPVNRRNVSPPPAAARKTVERLKQLDLEDAGAEKIMRVLLIVLKDNTGLVDYLKSIADEDEEDFIKKVFRE